MSLETKSILLDALPLFVSAALLLGAAVRRRAVAAVEPASLAAAGIAAAALGALVAADGRPLGGRLWESFAALLGLVAASALALVGKPARTRPESLAAPPGEEPERDGQLAAVGAASAELGRAGDAEAVARTLLQHARELLQVDFAALVLIAEDGTRAQGLLALDEAGDVPWFADVDLDLVHQPSGIASTVFEAAPVVVYDIAESPVVNRELATRAGAQSVAFVPLVASSRVAAVLVVATTSERRAFGTDDVALLETLAGEGALALDRTRSATALAEALERERLVAAIGRKVRSELDLDAVLRVAVRETARALDLCRCFIRLGGPGEAPELAAEWQATGLAPVGEAAPRLPASNLAARERRTVVVDDVASAHELEEPGLGGRETLAELGAGAVLATPVLVFDEMVGVLALHRREAKPWSPGDVSVAEAVAREVGLALHAARLLRENRERLEQQTALLEAARVVTGELHLETVLQRLVEEVAHLLEVDAADCYLIDPARGVFRCAAVHGLPESIRGFEFPIHRGLAAQALREGRSVLSNDYASLREPVGDVYDDFVSVIAAPMRWSDEIRGVLAVGTRRPDRNFVDSDLELLDAFAGLASLALQNAESFERGTRQARIESGFYGIASILGASLSLAETLDAVAEAACTALGGDSAAVLTPGAVSLELTGRHELPERFGAALGGELLQSAHALAAAARDRQVLAAPELETDDRFGGALHDLAVEAGYRSLLAIPVEASRSEEGGLVVVFCAEQREFTDDDLELAERLAQAARGALERSELFEAERNARALSQELARSGRMVSTELDPAAVLEEVVQRAPALLGADAAAVWVSEEGAFVATTASGHGAEDVVGGEASANRGPVADAAHGRVPVAIAHAAGDVAASEAVLASGFAAFLGVPLELPEGDGVLAVYSRAPRAWRTEEIESMSALAGNAAAALANAELYQRVAQEKERSFAILANIADGIVAVDREGKVVLWNAAAERITGVSASEALGREPSQVLQRTLGSGDDAPAGDRLVSISRGSEEVWLSLTEAVMRDPAGAVSGRIFAFRDISSERAVEQMKSDFVSAVSHELRTPLTSIYGFAETLLRGDVAFGDEERKTFLGYIASESERLTSIVDTLLNVARLDTGDLVVQLAPVDVRPVVSDVVADARGSSALDGHRIEVDLPPEPLDAHADADKLRQVLGQLVDNALRYSPGGGKVRIEGRRRDGVVELAVADEGIGVPHAEQERIFRKFYRGEAATREGRLGGTGLGLFIAHGLVSAMGGRIWVDSREGEGARFAFELPASPQAART